ncbi:ATP-binding cassette domain-containing protein [Alkalicella caledoniensis]|uniref:ATP-binding cassette domain-containing protein n=1 Tax=Alkalicella caledoniensis TaxID=2731377 RepID=A0A7G9W6C8_ALKCA|nr:ATP-binding cassette domain-containing protein [Alkalicella caledoniensis]QNO14240.1 ATP-binding cassette domain-containing protein [Alkalicella caledoniensis]
MRLEVKELYKTFAETEVLHGISFSVESGKALGFLGRNGAGKTTTIRILMNLFKANSGGIFIDGKEFVASEHQIGYLPEERGLYPKKKVMEQLVYLGQLRGLSSKEAKDSALFWLKRLGVEHYSNKKLDTLSKGNQQKVQLAETFICNPDIVILDEPFSGLDPVNAQILKDVIRELIKENKLVIFSSHQMGYIEEFCEDIALINNGEIVLKGNLKDIKRDYGMNRLIISVVNLSSSELEDVLTREMDRTVKVVDKKQNHLIIELQGNKTKNDLLKELVELNLDIEKFSIYEPTLEDIFVKKVGDK